jgi:DNA transformation protein
MGPAIGMKSNSFKEFILEQLDALGDLESRYMFGDWGLYCGEVFFGIVADGRLYFKTDSASRSQYLKAGMKPFSPNPKQTLVTYYEVPVDIVEDRDALTAWAKRAVRVSTLRGASRRQG